MTQSVSWTDTASMLSTAGTVLAVLVAIVGARVALDHISTSREAAALNAWNDYLRLCFENPSYACADQARTVIPDGLERLKDNSSVQAEKYQWFLSIVLNSCEQVLLAMPNVREWRGTLIDQIWYHADAIRQVWGEWKEGYSDEMQGIVDEGLRKGSDNA